MNQLIECAYCDGKAQLQKENRALTYRKEDFKIVQHFYTCESCYEEFTTTETDTITLLQAHNQYRAKHHIPFPEEIISTRDKYGLSAKKMSEVLGLGINGYSNYEKGEIPKPAMGNLIAMANNPEVFKNMLGKSKDYFSKGQFEKAIRDVNHVIIVEKKSRPFYVRLNQYNEPNTLTGFKKPNKKKIANLLVTFINNCSSDFNDKLKLNKLLFYADFVSYKLFGYSITGLSYRAIDYGPVPTFYDNIYTYFENEHIITSKWIKGSNGAGKETFITETKFDRNLFTEQEKLVINIILKTFKNISSWDLVDLSHEEQGWIDLYKEKKILSYQQYAFDLIGA